jgi:hypothetical protein
MTQVHAQSLTLPGGTTVTGPATSFTDIGSVINRALPFIFAFAGIGLLLMIISAGFSMLTSAGDSKKLDMGKQRLTNGLLGFLIILVAYWVTQILGNVFGITQITDRF